MLHVFATNKQVDDHNEAAVTSLLEKEIKIMADDYRNYVTTDFRRFIDINSERGTRAKQGKVVSKKTGREVQKKPHNVNQHVATLFEFVLKCWNKQQPGHSFIPLRARQPWLPGVSSLSSFRTGQKLL
ncbi:uncharacterized protein V6R79_014488 [Siganus canaliculatus]